MDLRLLKAFNEITILRSELELNIDKLKDPTKIANWKKTIKGLNEAYLSFKELAKVNEWYKDTHKEFESLRYANWELKKKVKELNQVIEKMAEQIEI